MKKTFFIAALVLGSFLFENANAQVRFGVNININSQPVWGPVGYDHVDCYYMPDIDAYYYVPTRQYIYLQQGHWVFASTLPRRFHYDVNTGYKVVVNDPRPYRHPETYRTKYASYKGRHDQEMIRNSHDSRYFSNKHHPEHDKWQQEQRHGNSGQHHN
jgi:hypothetical protein